MKKNSNILFFCLIAVGFLIVSDNRAIAATNWNYSFWSDQGINYTAPSGDAYYPSVIYDADGFGVGTPKYAMWYSDGAGAAFFVTSTDGASWGTRTPITGLINVHHVQVIYNADCFGVLPCDSATPKYKMWFWDMGASLYSISSMAGAESINGIDWTNKAAVTQNSSAKLVQDPDSGSGWNRGTYGPVSIFYQPNAINTGVEPWNYKYVMYYNGTDGGHEDTGLAYSTDGLLWNAYTSNPVLSGSHVGGNEAWNCASAVYGTVYNDPLGYHYFYSGRGQDDGLGGCAFPSSFNAIGYASSTDGKTWTKDVNPIFQVSDGVPYRSGRIYTPSIIDDGSDILRMYFSVKDSASSLKKIASATFIKPAILHVIKLIVNGNGGTAVPSDFTVSVKSSGVDVLGSPDLGTMAPGTIYALSAGTYTISENVNTSYTTSFTGSCDSTGSVTLSAGDDKICTIINTNIPPPPSVTPLATGGGGNVLSRVTPLIGMFKIPTPLSLPTGSGLVTYNYTVWNIGRVQALTDVAVTDDKCAPVTFLSGDLNNDRKLDPYENWKYSCTATLSKTTTNTSIAVGYSDDPYHDPAMTAATVTVSVGAPDLPNTGLSGLHPIINIVKAPSRLTPLSFGGGDITYSYVVTNLGAVPMDKVFVSDDKCAPIHRTLPAEIDKKKFLDPGKSWTYTCSTKISVSTRNVAIAEGRTNGFIALGYAFTDVLVSAPNFPDTGIQKGGQVFVTAKLLNVRNSGSLTSPILGQVSTKAKGVLLGETISKDGYVWGEIKYENGLVGWSVLDGLGVGSGFKIGDRVLTTREMNVRKGVGLNENIISSRSRGSSGLIVSGPVEGDGYIWWQVKYDNDLTGWTAEMGLTSPKH